MAAFTVSKVGKLYVVSGRYSVNYGKAFEDYQRAFRTKREADATAARWTKIEADAQALNSERRATRLAACKAYIAARAERKALDARQLDMFA